MGETMSLPIGVDEASGEGVVAEQAVSPATAATTIVATAPIRAMFLFMILSLLMVLCSHENTLATPD
jgi:hypothetical protein